LNYYSAISDLSSEEFFSTSLVKTKREINLTCCMLCVYINDNNKDIVETCTFSIGAVNEEKTEKALSTRMKTG